jgi:NDP-sugar pyrophosphorylase family protein
VRNLDAFLYNTQSSVTALMMNPAYELVVGDLGDASIVQRALVAFHRQQGATLTVATHQRQVKIDLGVIDIDDNHRVVGYRDKPHYSYDVSMGICVYEPHVLKHIEQGKYLYFPDLVLRLLVAGEKACAMTTDYMWVDIGRPDDYAQVQELFADKRGSFDFG